MATPRETRLWRLKKAHGFCEIHLTNTFHTVVRSDYEKACQLMDRHAGSDEFEHLVGGSVMIYGDKIEAVLHATAEQAQVYWDEFVADVEYEATH